MGSGGPLGLQNQCELMQLWPVRFLPLPPIFCSLLVIESTVMPSSSNFRFPQVEIVLQDPQLSVFIARLSRPLVAQCVKKTITLLRQSPEAQNGQLTSEFFWRRILQACVRLDRQRQQRVINATGTVIHTNLGRSPLSESLWERVKDRNVHYNNLEMALKTGQRGERHGLLPELLSLFSGAEGSLVVNNNASSVYLLLHELAKDKEVIVSRGEQIQIGGGFRIPDILALSGAKLVEVGTTNVTTASDYLNAVTENTALVLMVHQSNFVIRGFTQSADVQAVKRELPDHVALVVDQGSGLSSETFSNEETPFTRYLQWGADLVCFSGDKILGGPQAGILCGKSTLIDRLAKNPMMRAFRANRMVLSLLEEWLIMRLNGEALTQSQWAIRQIERHKACAETLVRHFPRVFSLESMPLVIGGGTLPDQDFLSWGVALHSEKPETLCRVFREFTVPIIATVKQNQLRLNMATILDDDFDILLSQLTDYFDAQETTL
jgi:L-seryl-tRNA(Ser) seleniumtransferase